MKVYHEIELEAKIEYYRPARKAPVGIFNHDDPRYGDSGDDEILEFELFIPFQDKAGKYHLLPLPKGEYWDTIYDAVLEDVTEKAREAWENTHGDNWLELAREA